MPLTFLAIKNARPGEKPYKLFDGSGLYIEVTPTDRRYWRLRYRFAGKDTKLAIGVFPEVTIKDARNARDAARKLLAEGLDPNLVKQGRKASPEQVANTFEAVAREWFSQNEPRWVASHSSKILRRLELHVFPYLGNKATDQIKALHFLEVLKRIQDRPSVETAHRALNNCDAIMRFAVITERATANPVSHLRGALKASKEVNHASVKGGPAIAALLRAIDGYKGSETVRHALRLAPLVFVRPGELRKAEWSEIDLDQRVWRIPAPKMKMRREHIVPLARQSIELLTSLYLHTGKGRFLFPGIRDRSRPMSENTVNAALRNLGYAHDEQTGHGFRQMASTSLNSLGFNGDHVELQLAHVDRNSIRRAYNHSQHLPERTDMMQKWADYLDQLKRPGKSEEQRD